MELLKFLILPPCLFFLVYGLGVLAGLIRPSLGNALRASALCGLYLLSIGYTANLLMYSLEKKTVPLNIDNVSHADAIVVLTAGRTRNAPEYDGRNQPDELALVRLRYAAHLHRTTKLPILIAGGSVRSSPDPEPLSLTMQRALADDFGVQAKWIEPTSHNTYTSAHNTKQILASQGIKAIILVTDAAHMYRAAMAFRQANFDVIEGPTHFLHSRELSLYSFLPSSKALWRSYYAFYQWLGILWYRSRTH